MSSRLVLFPEIVLDANEAFSSSITMAVGRRLSAAHPVKDCPIIRLHARGGEQCNHFPRDVYSLFGTTAPADLSFYMPTALREQSTSPRWNQYASLSAAAKEMGEILLSLLSTTVSGFSALI